MTDNSHLVFSDITPERYARLIEKARAAGIDLSGPSGRVTKLGVEIEWNYDDQKQELVLACLKAPFFMSMDDVHARLKTLVTESMKA